MKKLARLSLALLLLIATSTVAPPAKAICGCNRSINYYDCGLNLVGYWYYNCWSNNVTSDGQQSGVFKEVEVSCPYDGDSYNWYQWNGSSWVLISDPSPTC